MTVIKLLPDLFTGGACFNFLSFLHLGAGMGSPPPVRIPLTFSTHMVKVKNYADRPGAGGVWKPLLELAAWRSSPNQ